jgi:hypothetical protein
MKFKDFLKESKNAYEFTTEKTGNSYVFNITTGQIRDYRLSIDNDEARLGYASGKKEISPIKEDFYDTSMITNTIIDIFTGIYLQDNLETFKFMFQKGVDKTYKLLIMTIFKKELSNYYKIVTDTDTVHYINDNFIVLRDVRHMVDNEKYV